MVNNKNNHPSSLNPASQQSVKATSKSIAITVHGSTHSKDSGHPAKAVIHPRKPAASKTLMRQYVAKPSPNLKRNHKAHGAIDGISSTKVITSSLPKLRPKQRSNIRLSKSPLISHFSTSYIDPQAIANQDAVMPTAPVSTKPHINVVAHTAKPKAESTDINHSVLFEHAVATASSHKQTFKVAKPHRSSKKHSIIAAGMLVLFSLVGLAAVQSYSGIQLHLASAKAGFNVALPSYSPAGYSLNQLNYGDGVAAAQFHSNTDDRAYSITQKKSPWDSQTLITDFVAPEDKNYLTINKPFRTIYIYNLTNATWVSNGIWYVIHSNGSLTNRQLIDLASSV
ncbi:MAG: hypothetical protein NVS1B10_00170 [Candidatus Saccharimonadales bacterium]